MDITLLGTGTPTPSTKRQSSGYMVSTGDDVILFDHGSGAHQRMLESGTSPTDVTHLFFSHLHYDHCVDYARLVLTRWDQGAGQLPELQVYGPEQTEHMTELLFAEKGVFDADLTARTNYPGSLGFYTARGGELPRQRPSPVVTELSSKQVIEGKNWKVTTRDVIHQQPYLQCFGFRLDTDEGSFAYSGDCGPCKGMEILATGCDVLVHMCHYISGTALNEHNKRGSSGHIEVATLAAKAEVKTLVISHVTEQMDVPGIRERLIKEIGEIYDGNIIWGEDLMRIPLKGPTERKLL